MITRLFAIFCLVILSAGVSKGQSSAERSAFNNLNKERWDKAFANIKKAIRKDSLSPAAFYAKTLFFFSVQNPSYQIDSAYNSYLETMRRFRAADLRERDKLTRLPLDSTHLVLLRIQIEAAAFLRAMESNTEEGYIYFLQKFPMAEQQGRAEELRNEMAYLDALKENTYSGYLAFIQKYPNAERVPEAQKKYDKLLFTSLTADKKLMSYKVFAEDYPQSPYLQDALDEVFEIGTASGEASTFQQFVDDYPQSRKLKRAIDILYHIQVERQIEPSPLSDSLQLIQTLSSGYLVPFLRDAQFGMMNSEGLDVIKNIGSELPSDYLCGNITEDLLITETGIIGRNGSVIYTGKVSELEDLGFGFLLVTGDSCISVVHKTGYIVGEGCVDDAIILTGQLLAIKRDNLWSVWSLAGRKLTPNEYQEVRSLGEVIGLKWKDQWVLTTASSIGSLADGNVLDWSKTYDDVTSWNNELVWTKKGNSESVFNHHLQEVIPAATHQLKQTSFGVEAASENGRTLYNSAFENVETFQAINQYDPWLGVKRSNQWWLYDIEGKKNLSPAYDSLAFIGPVAIGYKRDSMEVYFVNGSKAGFVKSEIKFIPGKDSISFLRISKGEDHQLFNSKGEKLFASNFDQIQYLGKSVFVVSKKQKKGLVLSDGKSLLPLEYDGIGSILNQNVVPILKSMKFGIFNLETKKTIKPTYEKNLVPYGNNYLVAYKDGGYGFINWDNKPQSKFEFEEVRYWNDSIAWVKKSFEWMLYDVESKSIKLENIKDYQLIKDTPEEKLAIIHEDNAYGVISSTKGIIIPATFSDIVNIGSAGKPFYMTEKFVEEAALFVVIYYNHEGKFLRRQAYDADDYERIYCPK